MQQDKQKKREMKRELYLCLLYVRLSILTLIVQQRKLNQINIYINIIRTLQIRQIAKKYKTQYQELIKTNEEEKKKKEAVVMSLEEQEKLREEGRQEAESRQAERINQLTEQVSFILLIKSNTSFQKERYNIL